ncbi:MAG: cryptochrome/photolyase family protein, partial [Hyphomonas sp.]|nr:cryptochrome/photolyase family protein [Hyphomonas sp.]
LSPAEVNEWYLLVYADAYEWVELPNTHGMALHADGGLMASKPYAASGNYINKMSDYCSSCAYDVASKSGAKACPFNYLYWDFIARNRETLAGNPRMALIYKALDRLAPALVSAMRADADAFLDQVAAPRS